MKHLTRLTLVALALAALAISPAPAQTRGSRGSGASRSTSTSNTRSSSSTGSSSRKASSASSSSSSSSSSSQTRTAAPGSSSYKGLSTTPSATGVAKKSEKSFQAGTNSSSASQSSQTPRQSGAQASKPSQPSGQSSQKSSGSGVVRNNNSIKNGSSSRQSGSAQPKNDVGQSKNNSQPKDAGVQSRGNSQPKDNGARMSGGSQPSNWKGGSQPREVRMRQGEGRDVVRVAPRDRRPLDYNRPSRFWDSGRHYYGYRVNSLPTSYVTATIFDILYYIVDGVYYRNYNDVFYVCRPPHGVAFTPAIADVTAAVCNFAYFFSALNTYNTINTNAATITAQNKTIAENNAIIAQQNETIALNTQRATESWSLANSLGLVQSYADASTEYYYDDGVFFVKDSSGQYVTIIPPAGAVIQELPDDYDEITLNGTKYFKVDNTVYNLTIIDGTPYFEVLGQLTENL